MAKPNKRHHELCLKYKQEGRRERNKRLTAEKEQRKLEKIRERSAKKPLKYYAPKDPENRGTNRMEPLGDFAYRPKMDNMLPYQREVSFGRRIQNQLDAVVLEEKRNEQSRKAKNKNKEGNNG
mgnify:CR=1 FL=1